MVGRRDDPGRIGWRSPRDGWQVPGIIRGAPRGGRGPAARARRRRRAPPRTPPASSGARSRSSCATIGASASTTRRSPRAGRPGRHRPRPARAPRRWPRRWRSPGPAAAPPRARAARAASGIRSPSRRIGRRRGVVIAADPVLDAADGRGVGADVVSCAPSSAAGPPRPSRSRAAPGRGRRASSSSRTPGAAPRSGGRGAPGGRGSSSLKTSSSRSSGGRPSSAVRRSSSASLNARIAVRCWPRDAKPGEVAAGELEREVVAVRPDERRAVPDLLLGRLDEPAGQGVARRLAAQRRGVRHVAQRQAARRGLLRRDLAVGGRRAARRAASSSAQPRLDDPPAGLEERVVPEPELVAGGGLLADRPQQAVALLERAAVGREVVGVGREVGGGQRVDRRAAQATASR